MKLIKFFALTLGAISIIIPAYVLAAFAAVGGNQMISTAPHESILADLGASLVGALISGSFAYIVIVVTILWLIWSIAIFEDSIIAFAHWFTRFVSSIKIERGGL